MSKTVNQKAWFFVLPVVVLVAFNAIIPLMTVVNYSVQETFGDNLFFWAGVQWFEDVLNPSASMPPSVASCCSPSPSWSSRCRSASPSRWPCRARDPGSRSAWC